MYHLTVLGDFPSNLLSSSSSSIKSLSSSRPLLTVMPRPVVLPLIVGTCLHSRNSLSGKQGNRNRTRERGAGGAPDAFSAKEKAAQSGDFLRSGPRPRVRNLSLIRSCFGVPGRIRTRDPLLRRQPLCPLSYWDFELHGTAGAAPVRIFILQETGSDVSRNRRRLLPRISLQLRTEEICAGAGRLAE